MQWTSRRSAYVLPCLRGAPYLLGEPQIASDLGPGGVPASLAIRARGGISRYYGSKSELRNCGLGIRLEQVWSYIKAWPVLPASTVFTDESMYTSRTGVTWQLTAANKSRCVNALFLKERIETNENFCKHRKRIIYICTFAQNCLPWCR